MKCAKCGNKLTGKENFCRICGTPVKQTEEKESATTEQNGNEKILNSHNSVGKKIELTDNIDVTKIKLADHSNDNMEDVSGDEIKITKESADKEFKAMLEITSTENQPKRTIEDNIDLIEHDDIEQEISHVAKSDSKDGEMVIATMPGEANALDIQSTSELEELLSDNSQEDIMEKNDSTNKIDTAVNKDVSDELNESTMFIPDELIVNKSHPIDIDGDSTKTQELDEVTTPILPIKPTSIEKENSITVDGSECNKESEEIKSQDIINKSEIKTDDSTNSLNITPSTKDEKEPSSSETNISQNLDSFVNNDNEDELVQQIYPAKKGRKMPVIVLVLLLLICLGCLGYAVYQLINLNDELSNLKDDNKSLKDKIDATEKSNVQNSQIDNKVNQLKINGYDIILENANEYAIEGDSLLIKSKQNNIMVHFGLNIDYTSIKEKEGREAYKELLIDNDYDVTSYGTKYSDNREYVVYEVETKEDKKILIAYTSLSDDNTICFMISDSNNKIDYDSLKTTDKILESLTLDYSYEDEQSSLFIKEKNES